MRKTKYGMALLLLALTVGGCQTHKEMQYSPAQYAKLRGIELITREPSRPYELVATVEGFGGKFTSTNTMINSMIDEAVRLGARALLPVSFTDGGAGKGTGKPSDGLDQFILNEQGRSVTRARAVRWTGN